MFMPRFEAIRLALHALKEAVPATYLSAVLHYVNPPGL